MSARISAVCLFSLSLAVLGLGGCARDTALPADKAGKVTGQLLAGDAGLADVGVTLVSETLQRLTTRSDADGFFTLVDVPAGLHTLDVRVAGYAAPTIPQVRVSPGVTVDLGQLVFTPGPAVDGTIKGLVAGPAGANAAGAEVTCSLDGTTTVLDRRAVGDTGSFVIRVPPGLYALAATHPLYTSATRGMVLVRSGEVTDLTAAPLVLGLDPATVAGLVTKEQDGRQVPAVGAQVTIQPGGLTTTTDAMGRFSRGGLSPGTYSVAVSLMGYHLDGAGPTVMLAKGGTTDVGSVRLLLDRGSFRGAVVTGDRQPATNVRVVIQGTTFSTAVVPDLLEPWRARFQLDGVPVLGGPYVITAQGSTPAGVLYTPDSEPNQVLTMNGEVKTLARELQLAVTSGDFTIDDGDATSLTGYTRVRGVTLDLTRFTDAVEFRASEAADFADAGFRSFTGASQAFTLADADGTHTVYAEYKKAGGVTSARFQASIVLDRRAPQGVSIALAGGETFTNDNPLTLRLAAVDDPAMGADRASGLVGMRLSETGSVDLQGRLTTAQQPVAFSASYALTSLTEGARALFVQFSDAAGNVTDVTLPAGRLAFVYDVTPPVDAGLTLRRGALASVDGFTRDLLTVAQLTAAPEPAMGTLQVKLANSQAALSSATYRPFEAEVAHFLAVGLDGTRNVYARVLDQAGNESPELNASIVLDTTAPSPLNVSLVGSNVRATTAVTLNVSAMDSSGLSQTAGITISESLLFTAPGQTGPKAPAATGMESYTLSAGDGLKTVYVRARDRAGNDAVTAVQVVLDTTAPVLDAVAVDGPLVGGARSTTVTSSASVTLRLDATGATRIAASESALSCAAAMYVPFNGRTFAFTLSAGDGPKTVNVCVADDAGNTSGTSKAGTTRLATAAPTGCALTLSGRKVDGTAAPTGKTASATVTATVSGCTPSTNPPVALALVSSMPSCTAGAMLPYQAFAASQAFTLPGADGSNTVYGCVRDEAGNVGSVAGGTITLDRLGPVNVSVSVDNGAAFINAARFGAGSSFAAPVTGAAPSDAVDWAVGLTPPTSGFVAFVAATPLNVSLPRVEGTQRVWGVFRDDLGNATQVSDTIDVDTVAPTGANLGLQTPSPTPAYSNSVSVTLTLADAGVDTSEVLVGNAAGGACADSDFAGRVPAPRFDALTFLLTGGDGLKRVCAKQRDPAGNTGPMLTAQTTLDTLPPTAPEIVTQATFTNASGSFTVTTRGPVTEANFAAYLVSGATPAVTQLSVPQSTTSFQFNLPGDGAQEEGVKYTLRLWAKDLAGNLSPPSTVDVTVDTNAPPPPDVQAEWVDNGSGKTTVYFSTADAGDVAGYRMYYASAPAPSASTPLAQHYLGTYADQGPSPVTVPLANELTLSGLPNGSQTYVTLRSVDRAGNESAPDWVGPSGVRELILQPNETPLNFLGAVSNAVGAVTYRPTRVALLEDLAFVAGINASCTQASLHVYDLGGVRSAVQRGVAIAPNTPAILPTLLASRTWAVDYRTDTLSCSPWNPDAMDMVLEYPYVYLSAGGTLTIFSVLDPAAPSALPVTTMTTPNDPGTGFPRRISNIKVRGKRLFAALAWNADAVQSLYAVALEPLFDGSAGAVSGTFAANARGWASSYVGRQSRMSFGRGELLTWNPLGDSVPDDASAFRVAPSYSAVSNIALTRLQIAGFPSFKLLWPFDSPSALNFPDPVHSGDWAFLATRGALEVRSTSELGNPIYVGSYPRFYYPTPPTVPDTIFPLGVPNAGLQSPPLLGSELVLTARARLRVLELLDLSHARVSTSYERSETFGPTAAGSAAVAARKNLVVVGTEAGRVEIYRLATPRNLAVDFARDTPSGSVTVGEGFLYGGRMPVDLLRGAPQSELEPHSENAFCMADLAVFEDACVATDGFSGGTYRTAELTYSTDRDTSTNASFDLPPSGPVFRAIERYGNFVVVVAEQGGTLLQVYDASALRDGTPGTTLGASHLRGSLTLTADLTPRAQLRVHRGRAFVVLTRQTGATASQLFAVDLRAALDDDAATSLSASSIRGQVNRSVSDPWQFRSVAVWGGSAWTTLSKTGSAMTPQVGDAAGTARWDITALLAASSGSSFLASPVVHSALTGEFLDVSGTYLVTYDPVAGRPTQGRLAAFDVSDLTTPVELSSLSTGASAAIVGCSEVQGLLDGEVQIAGSHVYLGSLGKRATGLGASTAGQLLRATLEAP